MILRRVVRATFIFSVILNLVNGVIDFYGHLKSIRTVRYNGDPLFLTPLIESGRLEEARNLSKVTSLAGSVESYSGFFTVNKTYNTNMFFWFFPSESSTENSPVLIWLQGGPGASSMFGLLTEHGPYEVENNLKVKLRKYSWTKTLSVLYVDNPAGTGYSFTDSDDGYAKNEDDVATNLYKTVVQFFTMFPDLEKNDFFISGESYAGKYVPALAYKIHQENKFADLKINLKGLAIGNGLCDPINMLNYGAYLYEIGLIDANNKKIFDQNRMELIDYINNKKWLKAFENFDSLLNNDFGHSSIFTNVTGFTNYYNYLHESSPPFDAVNSFIQQDKIKKLIHVGNLSFHTSKKVEYFLRADIMQTVAPLIEVLIENYKILIYSGQLDIIVAYPLTEEFLRNLKWSGAKQYKSALRNVWKVKNQIAGYSKTVKNLTEVLVRNAGHMVPTDQPLVAFDMINRFAFNKPFYNKIL